MNTPIRISLAVAALAAVASAQAVVIGEIKMTVNGAPNSLNIGLDIIPPGSAINVVSGGFARSSVSVTSGSVPLATIGNGLYCVTPEISMNVPTGNLTWRVSLVKAYRGIFVGNILAGISGASAFGTTAQKNHAEAKRQAAIWWADTATVANITGGGSGATSAANAVSTAQAFVTGAAYSALGANAALQKSFYLFEPIGSDGKVLTNVQSLASEAVPEPATLALAAAGLAGAVRRRRARRG